MLITRATVLVLFFVLTPASGDGVCGGSCPVDLKAICEQEGKYDDNCGNDGISFYDPTSWEVRKRSKIRVGPGAHLKLSEIKACSLDDVSLDRGASLELSATRHSNACQGGVNISLNEGAIAKMDGHDLGYLTLYNVNIVLGRKSKLSLTRVYLARSQINLKENAVLDISGPAVVELNSAILSESSKVMLNQLQSVNHREYLPAKIRHLDVGDKGHFEMYGAPVHPVFNEVEVGSRASLMIGNMVKGVIIRCGTVKLFEAAKLQILVNGAPGKEVLLGIFDESQTHMVAALGNITVMPGSYCTIFTQTFNHSDVTVTLKPGSKGPGYHCVPEPTEDQIRAVLAKQSAEMVQKSIITANSVVTLLANLGLGAATVVFAYLYMKEKAKNQKT